MCVYDRERDRKMKLWSLDSAARGEKKQYLAQLTANIPAVIQ